MAMTYRLQIDDRGIRDLLYFFDNASRINEQIFFQAIDNHAPSLESQVVQNPPPARYPIAWTSQKQRKAYYLTKGFGQGIPTQRTNAINDGWRTERESGANFARYTLQNIYSEPVQGTSYVKEAKFVIGTFASDYAEATKFIQQFHKNTGWKPVQPMGIDFASKVTDDYYRGWEQAKERINRGERI